MEPQHGLAWTAPEFRRLLDALLLEHGPATRDAYRRDMQQFAAFLGVATPEDAAKRLVIAGPLAGNAMVLHFMDDQRGLDRASATIARRLACLKQLVRKARILGMCAWSIEIRSPKVRSYRDTRGPGIEAVRRMIAVTDDEQGALGARDRAMVRLLFDMGLRRGEVAGLDLADLEDTATPAVWVLEKGATQRVRLGLPFPTLSAIRVWLSWRGMEKGPLFHRLDTGRDKMQAPEALTGRAVHKAIQRVGALAGVRCWPHALRHSAITRVLDFTGDVRAGQRFSRHASLDTLQIYDDNRRDPAGQLSEALAADLDRPQAGGPHDEPASA